MIHENLLETIEYTGKRYRVKLPWKVGHPSLPSNYGNTLSRLRSQVRKLEKEPEVLREYDDIINKGSAGERHSGKGTRPRGKSWKNCSLFSPSSSGEKICRNNQGTNGV